MPEGKSCFIISPSALSVRTTMSDLLYHLFDDGISLFVGISGDETCYAAHVRYEVRNFFIFNY